MKKWFGYGWLALVLMACSLRDPSPADQVCLVTEIVRYAQQGSDHQEISRQQFGYENGKLTDYSEKAPNYSVSFKFQYIGGKVALAYTPDKSIRLSLDYDSLERIEKASYIVNDKECTVFSLYYASNDRLARLAKLVETRVMLPTHSFIASRTFQFSYRKISETAEDLVFQTVQNAYKDGSRSEEEFTFEQQVDNHSPFYDSGQAVVLALLALTNHTESDVGRYLQRFDCKSIQHQSVDADGNVSLSETSQFTTQFDNSYNPVLVNQFSRITVPADTVPADRQYLQTFLYNCVE
ncbi:hypothetical protein ACFPMF_10630 [Larkinella bovis]|uniref:DUF4292 domain-containing protein n=1 Tax=Larkinella bovis TaxID=683041 RepID=A0ABW0I8B6_9BACT